MQPRRKGVGEHLGPPAGDPSKEIAEELNRQYGLSVPKQKIVLEEPIKTFGVHRVKAKLYQDIAGEILVQVVEA